MHLPPPIGVPAKPTRAGTTLIELMVSLTVLSVAAGAAMASVSSFIALGDAAREKSVALLAAQQVVERMQATTFDSVFVLFNDTAADDPLGVVVPGAHFDVAGLTPRGDDADGRVGRVFLPVDPASPGQLREDFVDPDFAMPRDLDADGVVDALEHAADYAILPVRVVVEWSSSSGNRIVEIETILRNP